MSSKQDWYSTLPSAARWAKCGRSVLQGRSSLSTVSNTKAHSLTDTLPGIDMIKYKNYAGQMFKSMFKRGKKETGEAHRCYSGHTAGNLPSAQSDGQTVSLSGPWEQSLQQLALCRHTNRHRSKTLCCFSTTGTYPYPKMIAALLCHCILQTVKDQKIEFTVKANYSQRKWSKNIFNLKCNEKVLKATIWRLCSINHQGD